MNTQITFRILTFKIINFRINEILAQSFRFTISCQLILSLDVLFLKFNWHLFHYHFKSK